MCLVQKSFESSQIRFKREQMRNKLRKQSNFALLPKILQRKLSLSTNCSSQNMDQQFDQIDRNKPTGKYQEENQFFKEYEIQNKIGEGANSSIYKCRCKQDQKTYAVKINRFRDQQSLSDSKINFKIMKKLNHPNIIKYERYILDEQKMTAYIILEYCDYLDLKKELISRPAKLFQEVEVAQIIRQILSALKYLHSRGICHRDLKSQNILYEPQNMKIKLIDFECAKSKKRTEKTFQMWTKTGTLHYKPPQCFLCLTYSQKIDIWGLGVVAYQLLTGKLPFDSPYYNKVVKLIIQSQPDLENINISHEMKILLRKLLQKKPQNRFSAKQGLLYCYLSFQKVGKDHPMKKIQKLVIWEVQTQEQIQYIQQKIIVQNNRSENMTPKHYNSKIHLHSSKSFCL